MTVLKGTWNYPTKVLFGPGRIAELPTACLIAGMSRPLVVTDAGLAGSDIVARARKILVDAGYPAELFSDVKGNPTGENVDAGLAAYKAGNHDGVVAIGGGSALDVGKCIALMAGQTRPLWDFEDIGDWWTRADSHGIAPVVAVPTTAGTGSEVGRASVVTKSDTHEKKIIFHPLMQPKVVIADPELTIGLPPFLTAATGFDALAHCIEALCAPGFHPMADGIAIEGTRLIAEALPRAYANGADIEARAKMMAAASMGATAFQKGLGAVHSISHPVGAVYDTHHGLTNAVVLPYVLLWNRDHIGSQMTALARALDLDGDPFEAVLGWLLDFREKLGVPHTLGELGVEETRIPELAEKAERDPSTGSNPVPVTAVEFVRLIRCAVRGDLAVS